MDAKVLEEKRRQAAELELESYDFGYPVVDGSGWEFTTPGNEWVKPLFFQADEPGEPSLKGHFVVRFGDGIDEVQETYGAVDGEIVGNRTFPRP